MISPEVSLVLPTQGRRASLFAALRSALAQDFRSLEILVVDDSVGDPGWLVRPELATCLADPRVRLVPHHRGQGCAAAKNAGWAAATGRWVCYLDDDNEYLPGKISAQYSCALSTASPLVLCGLEIRVGRRRRVHQVNRKEFRGDDLLLGAHADTNVLFHRRGTPVRWDEELGTVDDACLFQALIRHYDLTLVPNVPKPLVIYTAHGGDRANRGFERFYRGQRRLLVRWSRGYSQTARRVLLLRSLVAFAKYAPGNWAQFFVTCIRLLRAGGWREWRIAANALGVRIPVVRRWMVT